MQFVGSTTPPAIDSNLFGEGPVFLFNEPHAEHLLYARAAWGIVARPDVPAAVPSIAPIDAPTTETEKHRLPVVWTQAWERVWAMYCASYNPDPVVPGVHPHPDVLDWHALIPPSRLSVDGFDHWVRAVDRRDSLNPDFEVAAQAAEEAHDRGLMCVFVLPVEGLWSAVIQERIMLVSTNLHDSATDLRDAFKGF